MAATSLPFVPPRDAIRSQWQAARVTLYMQSQAHASATQPTLISLPHMM